MSNSDPQYTHSAASRSVTTRTNGFGMSDRGATDARRSRDALCLKEFCARDLADSPLCFPKSGNEIESAAMMSHDWDAIALANPDRPTYLSTHRAVMPAAFPSVVWRLAQHQSR